jgi:hypothetical protein
VRYIPYYILLLVRPHKTVIQMNLTFSCMRVLAAYVELIYILFRLPILVALMIDVECLVVAVLSCSEFLPVAAVCVDQ